MDNESTEMDKEIKRCTVCKCERWLTDFSFDRLHRPYKSCDICRQRGAKNRLNKCIHGRQKYFCKDCLGNGICSHIKFKKLCPECRFSQP